MNNDRIQKAYAFSKNIYDAVLSQQTLLSRLYCDVFWSGTDDRKVAEKLLNMIPDDLSGMILDVPCGTCVFTEKKWKLLSRASIYCLDYSEDMFKKAKGRLHDKDILFHQGDVSSLPYNNETFDLVVSMNGFHAFPDKMRAYMEINRVLKPGGKLLACFYVKKESMITDALVMQVLSRKGWFTPPFITEERLNEILMLHYKNRQMHKDGSIVYFQCEKI